MAFVSVPTAASQAWAKIKFYYAHSLSSLSATTTATGYDVDNLLSRLEITKWVANTAAAQYITYDAGAGNTYTADYLALSGHNLNTKTCELSLEYSDDNFVADINDAFTPYTPTSDKEIVKEFTSVSERYWRMKISVPSPISVPYAEIAIAYWGELTELDYASSSFGPNDFKDQSTVNVSESGYVVGVHEKFKERSINLQFGEQDEDFLEILETWEKEIAKENFFVAWEIDQHDDDVFLMRSNGNFNAPLVRNGQYRNISIGLVGRMQE